MPFIGLTDATVWAKLYECRDADWARGETALHEVAERLLGRQLLKCAIDKSGLEPAGAEDPLDDLASIETRRTVACRAGVKPDTFAYKRSTLPLVGVSAKPTEEQVTEAEAVPTAAWIKTVKLAEPSGEPEPLVEQEGLVRYLSKHQWVTRRIFVRENPNVPKELRTSVVAIRSAVRETVDSD
jgi:hypothetical protein